MTDGRQPNRTRMTRLTLVARGATAANRSSLFGVDASLEQAEIVRIGQMRSRLREPEAFYRAPERAAVDTAQCLHPDGEAILVDALRDMDYGAWNGQSLADIAVRFPSGLERFIADPLAAPHGGESLEDVRRRVSSFLDECLARGGSHLAVTHAMVVKVALAHAIGAPLSAIWHLDVEPLGQVTLTGNGQRWALREFGSAPAQAAAGTSAGGDDAS